MTYAEILYLVSPVRWLPLVSIYCFERNFGPFGSKKLTMNTKLLSFYLEVENLFRIRVALYYLREEFTNDDYGLKQERSCNAENKLSISTQRPPLASILTLT
jgi:hypothetical protein